MLLRRSVPAPRVLLACLALAATLTLSHPPAASAKIVIYHTAAPQRGRAAHPTKHRARQAMSARQAMVAAELGGLVNAARARAGCAPLALEPDLNAVAQWRSEDMATRHYFSHQIPGVGYVDTVLDQRHIPWQAVGENIAENNYTTVMSLSQAIQDTHTDLMNSPEHRANILDQNYTAIGIGVATDASNGMMIVTEVFRG